MRFRRREAGAASFVLSFELDKQEQITIVRTPPRRRICADFGGVPEWLKGTDCKSVGSGLRWFESNPLHQHLSTRDASPAGESPVDSRRFRLHGQDRKSTRLNSSH